MIDLHEPEVSLTVALLASLILLPMQMVTPSPPTAELATQRPESDDIVVTALRDIDAPDSAVTTQTLGSRRTGNAVGSRTNFDRSRRWAACAVDVRPERREWLRRAIDSRTNSTGQAFAMRRLNQIHNSCTPDPQRALSSDPDPYATVVTDPYYDRGALVIAALQTFAPTLRLTKAETGDPAIQARFNAREVPLAKFRLPVDRTYFETAICFVRLQPQLAVRLAMTDKPLNAQRRLEAAIVNRAKICVGNAQRVYFDGTQFRFYIADAVYRWAVAVRNVATLIPVS